MLDRIRSHVANNVVGYIGVFLALGGTSYAAATGSIDSREIKNNTIRSKDIRNGQVRGRDIRTGAVSTSDVRNRSLLSEDFKPGQLPAGPGGATGSPGARGATGARGPSNGYYDEGSTGVPATFTLPPGRYIIAASTQTDTMAATSHICTLLAGGLSQGTVQTGPSASGAMQLAGTFTTPAVATLSCSVSYDAQLSAIRVASLN